MTPILAFLVLSCAENTISVEPSSISGIITNPTAEMVNITATDFKQELAVDSTGSFSGSFNVTPGYYTFSHGRERSTIYLAPGMDLELGLDTELFDESIEFTGNGADENNYLAEKYLLQEEIGGNFKEFYMMEESAFKEKNDADRQVVVDLLEKQESLSSVFESNESKNVEFEYIGAAQNYESYHEYYTKKEDFSASDAFNEQFAELDFENESDFLNVPAYYNLVRGHFMGGDVLESLDKLKGVESTVIVEGMVSMLAKYLSPGTENLQDRIEDMKALTSDEEIVASLDESYSKMEKLQMGNTSPQFNFEDINGEFVALEDLKGKNVYIDVWATWCGPCKAEIPHLKTLEEAYHSSNIEFVSVSVDVPKDKQKWVDMVADKELKGIQLISDNGWDTDFVENYLIKGIPRFILLDDEGNIVTSDAPRPSSGSEIKDMIDGLNVL